MMGDSAYEVSWLSKLFHSFPHVDLTFQRVNSSFQPEEARYRESLVFWAAVPVLWLLVTLLVFLMYFCYRCCQRDVEKKQRVPCLKWSMAVLALLTCAFVGVGFYGNEEVWKATNQFKSIVEDSEDTVKKVQSEIVNLDNKINEDVDGGLRSLQEIFRRFGLNATAQKALDDLVQQCMSDAASVVSETENIKIQGDLGEVDALVDRTETYGFYRWLATLLFLIWMVLLCLLLLFGIARSSKCTLLMFCAFGIFTLVVCWMSAGIHTATAMGTADFCVDPDTYIESLYKEKQQRVIIDYYIKCQAAYGGNPYIEAVQQATEHLRQINSTLKKTLDLSEQLGIRRHEIQYYLDMVMGGMDASTGCLIHLTALVECTNLHKDYMHALEVVCDMSLPGLVFILLSCMLCGFFFTILVILASRAWRHFSRSVYTEREEAAPKLFQSFESFHRPPKKESFKLSCIAGSSICSSSEVYKLDVISNGKGYLEVDEDDPFLPRGDNSTSYYRYGDSLHSRPNSVVEDGASFTRSGRPPGGGAANNREPMSAQRRPTPPPASTYRPLPTPPPAEAYPAKCGPEIDLSEPSAPPQYNSYDYRSPTEVHHMPDSPTGHNAPLACQDDYPTFRRESAA